MLVSCLVVAGYLTALLATGVSVALCDWLLATTARWWIALPLALGILGLPYRLLSLPLAWVSGFWLPRRYGLLHQPFRRWLLDVAKASAIGAVLALAASLTVYGLLRSTPWWWLYAALAFLAGYALLAWITPVWLVPLFYRLVPLADVDLRDRLLRVAARAGVPVLGVWVADQSRKGRAANAAVVGLGRTRRIVLFDTLIRDFSPAEVEAVLAHELAHQVHGDIGRGLLVQGAFTLFTLWVADWCLRAGAAWLGFSGPADLAGLPLLGLVLFAVGLVILPFGNAWSRRVERQADDFAVRTAGDPAAFITAMDRLANLNLADRDPPFVEELLFYSHPSVARRVARAQALLRSPG